MKKATQSVMSTTTVDKLTQRATDPTDSLFLDVPCLQKCGDRIDSIAGNRPLFDDEIRAYFFVLDARLTMDFRMRNYRASVEKLQKLDSLILDSESRTESANTLFDQFLVYAKAALYYRIGTFLLLASKKDHSTSTDRHASYYLAICSLNMAFSLYLMHDGRFSDPILEALRSMEMLELSVFLESHNLSVEWLKKVNNFILNKQTSRLLHKSVFGDSIADSYIGQKSLNTEIVSPLSNSSYYFKNFQPILGLQYFLDRLIWLFVNDPTFLNDRLTPIDHLFPRLTKFTSDLNNLRSDSLTLLDIKTFLVTCVEWSLSWSSNHHGTHSLMPAMITSSKLCHDDHRAWWSAVVVLTQPQQNSADLNTHRIHLLRGLETIRMIGDRGADLILADKVADWLYRSGPLDTDEYRRFATHYYNVIYDRQHSDCHFPNTGMFRTDNPILQPDEFELIRSRAANRSEISSGSIANPVNAIEFRRPDVIDAQHRLIQMLMEQITTLNVQNRQLIEDRSRVEMKHLAQFEFVRRSRIQEDQDRHLRLMKKEQIGKEDNDPEYTRLACSFPVVHSVSITQSQFRPAENEPLLTQMPFVDWPSSKIHSKFLPKSELKSEPETLLSFAGQTQRKLDSAQDAVFLSESSLTAEPVALAIEQALHMTALNLSGITISIDAGHRIASALRGHPELERSLFSSMLHANVRLVELDLSDNAFGEICVKSLDSFFRSPSAFSLQILKMNNNGLGAGGLILARALLDCHCQSVAIGPVFSLKVFVAGRNRLENAGALALSEAFATIGTLEEVSIPQNGILHEGICALARAFGKNRQLNRIDLNDNTFSLQGSESMARILPLLINLEIVNFGNCLCRNRGVELIANSITNKHHRLEELNLSGNEIGPSMAEKLLDKFTNWASLKLKLSCNNFGSSFEPMKKSAKESQIIVDFGDLSDDGGSLSGSDDDDDDDDHC